MTPSESAKFVEEKLTAASGKPVLVQRDANCAGHASIKIASDKSDSSQRNRDIRHFLSTLESYRRWFERRAKKTPTPDTMNVFDMAATTLEHIYPRSANPGDKLPAMEPLKNRLANLAIMAQPDNCANANAIFQTKKTEFAKSNVHLTKRLSQFSTWNTAEFNIRENGLINLALAVFSI